jgi:O-methyltransferase
MNSKEPFPRRINRFTAFVQVLYRKLIRSENRSEIQHQRLKLLWYIWGYYPLLFVSELSLAQRLNLLVRCLEVDWQVLHGHRPIELAHIFRAIGNRQASPSEIFVEAGCWNGGSSIKFSIFCKLLGYRLHIFDSFAGVEQMKPEDVEGCDFSGAYATSEEAVRTNLKQFGELDVCELHKGWFADSLANKPLSIPVRCVYIDCDLAKGTKEVLSGVMPALVDDGWIFSQDFHIKPVQRVLRDPETWKPFHRGLPEIRWLAWNLASFRFPKT